MGIQRVQAKELQNKITKWPQSHKIVLHFALGGSLQSGSMVKLALEILTVMQLGQ